MYHLPMKPAVGGKPPSESRNTVIRPASAGPRLPQAGKVAQLVVLVLRRAEQRHDAERAEVRDGVGQQVEQHRGLPGRRRRDDAEQQVAGVRDARIGEHPLDVGLHHADDRAEDHRRGGNHRQHRESTRALSGSSGDRNTRTNAANAAALTPVDMNAVTIVGAPSYASGVHMWNGTADTLNAKPTASRPTASSASVGGAGACAATARSPICSSRVEPETANANAMP